MISPNVFFFKIALIILMLLAFHIYFRISFSVSTKKKNPTYFYWNCVNPIDKVWGNIIIHELGVPMLEHGVSIYLDNLKLLLSVFCGFQQTDSLYFC